MFTAGSHRYKVTSPNECDQCLHAFEKIGMNVHMLIPVVINFHINWSLIWRMALYLTNQDVKYTCNWICPMHHNDMKEVGMCTNVAAKYLVRFACAKKNKQLLWYGTQIWLPVSHIHNIYFTSEYPTDIWFIITKGR